MVFLGWKAINGNIKLKADQIIKQIIPFLLFMINDCNVFVEAVVIIGRDKAIASKRTFGIPS